jgi:phenylacetate-CoA ligase
MGGAVSQGIRRPWQAVDYNEVARLFPPPPEYFEHGWLAEPEEIDKVKLSRLRHRADQAYRVPFFQRRWSQAGFHPRDLRSLEDLAHVPTYTIDDIRQSIESCPPYGDYQGVTVAEILREPMRIHMSGGTTGAPRPTLYTEWDRAAAGVRAARGMYLQGLRPGDVVLNSWSYALHNGAFAFDDALYRWLNCLVLTTGVGTVTSTRKQVQLAREYKAAAILTTGDFLLRIADEARTLGLDPKEDLYITSLATNIGNEQALEDTFGVPAYSTYGFHEVGYVAVECAARQGLHVFEDAFDVEVVDVDTGQPVPDGEVGAMVITEFCKTGSPQFRYNIMDLSYRYPREQCACGSWLRRIGHFAGRGDNMVKLRGVNIWPEGIGRVVTAVDGLSADYFVRATRSGGRDELTVSVVSDDTPDRWPAHQAVAETRLAEHFGVKVGVEVVAPGALDALTTSGSSPKPKRFVDDR